jgi:orotidine-5'-phosphate decarboxylase
MSRNPIIVALDVANVEDARGLVRSIGAGVGFYKVGMELYCAAGMDFVRELLGEGKEVFLDLKFYDIGETVKRAVAQVATTGVRFLTIHAVGQVMRSAIEGRGAAPLQLLAVTVLTSFDREDVVEMGYSCEVSELVLARAAQAIKAGVNGIVASPLDAAAVRAQAGPSAIIVTPGVRSTGAGKGDQKRVATPAEALQSGANYVVIGRQITRAKDPAAEVDRVLEEIADSAVSAL